MKISLLRQATKSDHAAVEASINLLSATLTREEYVETLLRMESFVRGWESLAESLAPLKIKPLVHARMRHALLELDLQDLLGDVSRSRPAPLPSFHGSTQFLGALYVIEGSRLGGQFIAQHVDDRLRLNGRGTSYFRGFGDTTGSMWKEVLQVLEREIPEGEAQIAIAAAKRMFHAFGSWMSGQSAVVLSETPARVEVSENGR